MGFALAIGTIAVFCAAGFGISALRQRAQERQLKRVKAMQAKMRSDWMRDMTEIRAHLSVHDEQIAKLQFKAEQAANDIKFLKEQLGALYGQLDLWELEQAGAVPGSKTDVRCQNKIIALENRIHTAEKKLAKAKFDKEQAARKMEGIA